MSKTDDINLSRQYPSFSASAGESKFESNCMWLGMLAAKILDLRTSIYSIHGMAEVLSLKKMPVDVAEPVDAITQSSDTLLAQINKLIELVRLMSGDVDIQLAPFDLQMLVEQIGKDWASRVQDKDVEFIIDYDLTAPTHFIGDVNHVQQILDNLIANAVAETERGHILLACVVDAATSMVKLSVQDTRKDFNKEKLANIFTNATSDLTQVFNNKSFDLPFAKGLVELIQGELHINLDNGCCFTCHLPMESVQNNQERSLIWPPHIPKPRILIVDDNELRGSMLGNLTKDFDSLRVKGDEAVQTIRQESDKKNGFQIVVIDQSLTSIDVRSITRTVMSQLRVSPPMLVALTQKGDIQSTQLLKAQGYSICIEKPVRQSSVIKAIFEGWQAWLKENNQLMEDYKMSKANILVVEDNPLNQKVALYLLRELGCDVEIADRGEKALQLVEKNKYDLIFMDVGLPGMCGFTVTSQIRANENKQNPVPIIALTAQYLESDKPRYDKAGMNEVLTKPVTLSDIEATLVRWVPFMQKRDSGAVA